MQRYNCRKTNSVLSIEACKTNRNRAFNSDIGEMICCKNCTDYLSWGKEQTSTIKGKTTKPNPITEKLGFANNKDLANFYKVKESYLANLFYFVSKGNKLTSSHLALLDKMADQVGISVKELIGYEPTRYKAKPKLEFIPELKEIQLSQIEIKDNFLKNAEHTLERAVENFGLDNQLRQAQEECAELIVAINKFFRTNNPEQIKIMFASFELVEIIKTYKLARLGQRIEKNIST